MLRRGAAFAAIALLTSLTGCGDGPKDTAQPATTAASPSIGSPGGTPAPASSGPPAPAVPSNQAAKPPPPSQPPLPPLATVPPKGFTDQRPGNELYGRVTRGGSGPCYGLVTEAGQEYALHSTEGVELKTGTWVRVRYTQQRARIDCGAGTPVSMVAVSQVK